MRVAIIGIKDCGKAINFISSWIGSVLDMLFTDQEENVIICGGAEGVDELFGTYIRNYDDAELAMYLPNRDYRNKRISELKKLAKDITWIAEEWEPEVDILRDAAIINSCDILLAVSDGTKPGRVWYALEYAKLMGKPIIYFPQDILNKLR